MSTGGLTQPEGSPCTKSGIEMVNLNDFNTWVVLPLEIRKVSLLAPNTGTFNSKQVVVRKNKNK